MHLYKAFDPIVQTMYTSAWPYFECDFVKVGFHEKVVGFWAFEDLLPFQKYRRPPILVRYVIAFNIFEEE